MGKLKISEVFTPGGLPKHTYNPRERLGLEKAVDSYLAKNFSFLAIYGSSKLGKTVLAHKCINDDENIWLDGGSVSKENDFWENLSIELELAIERTIQLNNSFKISVSAQIMGELNKLIAKIRGTAGTTLGSESSTTEIAKYNNLSKKEILDALISSQKVLVIDDFHYISGEVQKQIVRALKQPVFKGLKVVILCIPHKKDQIFQAEPEVHGRVKYLPIPLWDNADLEKIATEGFNKLKLNVPGTIIERFSKESYGSPHLMQEFCIQIGFVNDIHEEQKRLTTLSLTDFDGFFKEIANDMYTSQEYRKLKDGPVAKRPRKSRILKDGTEKDIYDVILHALKEIGPKSEVKMEEIVRGLQAVLDEGIDKNLPSTQEVSRVLNEMTKIASEQMTGEAVLEWKQEGQTLLLPDPYFLFYLRWYFS